MIGHDKLVNRVMLVFVSPPSSHYGTKPGHSGSSKIHFPTSEGVSKVSDRANAVEGASEASSPEQANE